MTNDIKAIADGLSELLPCPFCGSEAKRITIGEDEPNNVGGDVIVCTRCQASSHVEFGRKENLVAHWNTRSITTLEAENASLRVALGRLAKLTPAAANAETAKDLHLTVSAIAETALDRALSTQGTTDKGDAS